ncbi:MAG: PDZ domain-containing protein [Candidatus Omnitrophica bacterium]|nr:PDZ domain-containing protein [Candidatus Omnitrophota bacterium]
MKYRLILPVALVLMAVFFCVLCFSDTVILKNGKKLKGLIISEYKDRIILSTAEGERSIMKSSIRSAVYSEEKKALLQKARNQFKRRQYLGAYYSYKQVLELDPDLREAREKTEYLRNLLETRTREQVEQGLERKNEHAGTGEYLSVAERLLNELGLVLSGGKSFVVVRQVRSDAPGQISSSVKKGDRIVSVWSDNTGHMDAREVGQMLLLPGEVKMTVEREVALRLNSSRALFARDKKITGATFRLEKRGIVVSSVVDGGPFDKAGINKGDLIYSIDGERTRYMPFKRFYQTIRDNQKKRISVTVRRQIEFWHESAGE